MKPEMIKEYTKEIKKRKKEMEYAIGIAVNHQMKKFQLNTGIAITDISVYCMDVTGTGMENKDIIISEVTSYTELG